MVPRPVASHDVCQVLSLSLRCCRAEDGKDWFAQMRLVFTADVDGSSKQVLLVCVQQLTKSRAGRCACRVLDGA